MAASKSKSKIQKQAVVLGTPWHHPTGCTLIFLSSEKHGSTVFADATTIPGQLIPYSDRIAIWLLYGWHKLGYGKYLGTF